MDWLTTLPIWLVAVLIFLLRIVDVSLGTVRMLTVVAGRMGVSVMLGFIEILVWIFAISQVITQAGKNPWLMLAYAGGFAAGNATGIWVEGRLAMGRRVLRIISPHKGQEIAEALRNEGQAVTTFLGEGRDGHRTLLYLLTERRDLERWIDIAQGLDPHLFYVVEPVSASSQGFSIQQSSGPRSILKKR